MCICVCVCVCANVLRPNANQESPVSVVSTCQSCSWQIIWHVRQITLQDNHGPLKSRFLLGLDTIIVTGRDPMIRLLRQPGLNLEIAPSEQPARPDQSRQSQSVLRPCSARCNRQGPIQTDSIPLNGDTIEFDLVTHSCSQCQREANRETNKATYGRRSRWILRTQREKKKATMRTMEACLWALCSPNQHYTNRA